jgi:xylulokinase
MLLLGIDLGTSSVNVSVVEATTRQCLASVSYPEVEREIQAREPSWAEQDPQQWWHSVRQAILKAHATQAYNPADIGAVGIAYQMHSLVLLDKHQQVLRKAINRCDSLELPHAELANAVAGAQQDLKPLLNSPGNLTAAKLAWVKAHEPEIYVRIKQVLLPSDFLALQFTGEVTTSISALSEGVSWDFAEQQLSEDVVRFFGLAKRTIPPMQAVFAQHGTVLATVAAELSLQAGIPVTYKAGGQPNNALALGVLEPGEVAATVDTSGVIYAVTDQLLTHAELRLNTFAHVNHTPELPRLGVRLDINGAENMNRWVRQAVGRQLSYPEVNWRISHVPPGSEGLLCLPASNGAEHMLAHNSTGACFVNLDQSVHSGDYMLRAAHEGVAFAFRYGLDLVRENGLHPTIIKASKTNVFLSEVFAQVFANVTGLTVELYQADGSVGAALGAGIGAGAYATPAEACGRIKCLQTIMPNAEAAIYEQAYERWKEALKSFMPAVKHNAQLQHEAQHSKAKPLR